MEELMPLYIAYTIVWAGFFGYIAYLHSKQSKLEKDLKLLEDMVGKDD
jgi:CcmD family protein